MRYQAVLRTVWICATCGVEHPDPDRPPTATCVIRADERSGCRRPVSCGRRWRSWPPTVTGNASSGFRSHWQRASPPRPLWSVDARDHRVAAVRKVPRYPDRAPHGTGGTNRSGAVLVAWNLPSTLTLPLGPAISSRRDPAGRTRSSPHRLPVMHAGQSIGHAQSILCSGHMAGAPARTAHPYVHSGFPGHDGRTGHSGQKGRASTGTRPAPPAGLGWRRWYDFCRVPPTRYDLDPGRRVSALTCGLSPPGRWLDHANGEPPRSRAPRTAVTNRISDLYRVNYAPSTVLPAETQLP